MIKFYTILPDNDDIGGARQATKISILLNEIGEAFETIDLDRKNYVRPRDSEYRKLNPNSRVPTIDDEGFVLWEAGAILTHIANTRPAARKFLPEDSRERARVMQWLFWEGTTLTPDMVTGCALVTTQQEEGFTAPDTEAMVLAAGGAPYLMFGGDKGKEKQAWDQAIDMLQWDMGIMNEGLQGRKYFGGEQMALADIALAVPGSVIFLLGQNIKQHSNVCDWFRRLAERESFQATPSFMAQIELATRDGLI